MKKKQKKQLKHITIFEDEEGYELLGYDYFE
jgi:hypothetical protein